jgi:PAS domain S-box-containing protein
MTANTTEISQFLDYLGVIIIVIDPEQKVSYINKKGCEILGYEKEDILGKNWFDNFLPEKIREDIKTVFDKLIGQEIELAEYFDNVVLTKDGRERVIGWHNLILKNDAGTIVGILSWGEDITQRRRDDEKRENLVQELADRVTELKSTKMNIPICSLDKKDLAEAMRKHYRLISTEGKCSECLHVLKMVSQIKK